MLQRRSRSFTIFHFTKFVSDFICILIRVLPWAFLQGQNIKIWLFIFLCLGYPSGIEKNFLSVSLISYSDFNRTRRADHEYHIFIKIWSSNKKIIKAFPYLDDIAFLLGNNVFLTSMSLESSLWSVKVITVSLNLLSSI